MFFSFCVGICFGNLFGYCEFESHPGQDVQHYVIKFVSDWLEGLWFSSGTSVSSTYKTDCHDITEILLKVVLYTINQTKSMVVYIFEMEARQTKYLPVLRLKVNRKKAYIFCI
jgi:predicted nucleotide-binding protein (sugar kinase/HSP70/actin superfamily)